MLNIIQKYEPDKVAIADIDSVTKMVRHLLIKTGNDTEEVLKFFANHAKFLKCFYNEVSQ